MAVKRANEESKVPPKHYQRPVLIKGPVLADVTAVVTVSGIPSDL